MKNSQRLLAVFAHPDDESFRPGGSLAIMAAKGVEIFLLTATRGELGFKKDKTNYKISELGKIREEELRCACRVLGIQPPIFLGYADKHLRDAPFDKITSEIIDVVEKYKPQVILTYGPDGISGHPDHIAISHFVTEAFWKTDIPKKLYYMVVPKSLVEATGMTNIHYVPDEEITLIINVISVLRQKLAAIHCHKSQISDSVVSVSSLRERQRFLATETFKLAASRLEKIDKDLDFFYGL
ncbi:MAG: PIG-L family deacetylase [Actinobacteria bacterium]|nr:PIG-L family deacetylase [Actinomycetota bacterium]